MIRREKSLDVMETRLKRLARKIEELTDRDSDALQQALEMLAIRRMASMELYTTCGAVVGKLNRLLPRDEVILDPREFSEACFQEDSPNLLQINIRGRILQISYSATGGLVSTEDFRIPYSLEGAVRGFNQQLLEKDLIEEQLIFYTLEKDRRLWRYFDPRTYRSGPLDEDYLLSLLELVI